MQHLIDECLSPGGEQEAFRAVFEQAGFGVAQLSLAGGWLAVNQAFCEILGYSREELLAEPLQVMTRFDDLKAEETECLKLLRDEVRSFSSQKRHLRRDGRVIWLKGTVTLVREEITGRPRSFLAIIEDRTLHRKAIQQALADSNEDFRSLTDNISDLFFTLDTELRCSFWNRAAESLTGVLSGAVLGKRIGDAFSEDEESSKLEEVFREVLATRHARSFTFASHIAGNDFLFEVTAYPLKDGLSVVARDVAPRRRAEEALRKSEEKFAKAFQASPAIITIVRINDQRYIEVNQAFEKHLGITQADVEGRSIFEVGGDNLQRLQHAFSDAVANGSVRNMEAHVRRKNGEPLTVLLSAEVVDFDGQPCVLTVAEDITERKHAELARTELLRRLMTAQEAERKRIARELHDGIGQSLALLGIQLQRAGQPTAPGKKSSGVAELCAKVKDIGTQVSRLSHQLHSSELEFLGLAVAVKGLCREFSEQYQVNIQCVCGDLSNNLDDDVALCMLRLVQEGLHNVVKHSRAKQVNVELLVADGELSLMIADDGVGFDTSKLRTTGGLGLVSMGERMQLVGGQFEIESKPGGGTTIRAKVPLATVDRGDPPEES